MTWDGWFQYDGNEIVNVARTETYLRNAGYLWLRPQYDNDALGPMLGDGIYRTPLLDDAPWLDPDAIESGDFYGVYPLGVTGFEDSSRVSVPTESLGDGGVPGRLRNAIKTLTFNMLLVAATDAAADYGMRWLKQALSGSMCGPGNGSSCNGAELCYLASTPELEAVSTTPLELAELNGGWPGPLDGVYTVDGGDPSSNPDMVFDGGTPWVTGGVIDATVWPFLAADVGVDAGLCLLPLLRSLRRVLFNSGPTIASKATTTDGASLWTVQFTAVAGNPYELGVEVPVIEGFLDPLVTVPWAGGVEPVGAAVDLDGFIYPEQGCAVPVYGAIYDPLGPALIAPPDPPTIPLGHYVPPTVWQRRQITIPDQFIPSWGEVVPKLSVHATTADVRNLRLRFYADPYAAGDISNDPCAYCGDIVVSYVPAYHSLVLDGADQTVYIIAPGGARRRADSLVFATDGTPFEWPALTCGYGYVATFDLPTDQDTPVLDLSLYARAV